MITFKTFLIEEKNSNDSKTKNVESLPLYNSHEGTIMSANMMDGLFNKLLGKSSKVKTEVQHPGVVIGFGYNPKNGQFAISHNDKMNHNFNDIENNYDDPELKQQLKHAATHLPNVVPKGRGLYLGKLVNMNDYNKPVKIMVTHDHKGSKLTNTEKSKFGNDPNVTFINPEVKADPTLFKPDEIKNYKKHMTSANAAYGKLDPDTWDYINKGHHNQLEKYVQESDKPNLDGYIDHLTQIYGGKSVRASDNANQLKVSRTNNRFKELMDHISTNKKHYSNAIDFLNHLKNASNILSNVTYRNGNNNHVILSYGDNQSLLKIKKV